MGYVYILKSKTKDWRYVGYTRDLKNRFNQHNEGKSAATRSYKPFKLVGYFAVQNENVAIKLEKYFKTGSGIAWMNKHLMPNE